jgi:hypothetical protein
MKTNVFVALALAFTIGCGDDGGTVTPKDAAVDADEPDAPDCFAGTPTTHEEIINACTTAEKIYKNSKPPLLEDDGSLPPLPP